MPQAAIAADLHQALDVHGNLSAQIALYLDVVVNVVAQLTDIFLSQILHAGVGVDARVLDDIVRDVTANYVRAISMRFSLGRSTPAIRAMCCLHLQKTSMLCFESGDITRT